MRLRIADCLLNANTFHGDTRQEMNQIYRNVAIYTGILEPINRAFLDRLDMVVSSLIWYRVVAISIFTWKCRPKICPLNSQFRALWCEIAIGNLSHYSSIKRNLSQLIDLPYGSAALYLNSYRIRMQEFKEFLCFCTFRGSIFTSWVGVNHFETFHSLE